MSELKKLVVVLSVVILIAIITVVVFILNPTDYFSDLTADYNAHIIVGKNLMLIESYTYHVKKPRFKMLYRIWKAPLFTNKSFVVKDIPRIVLMDMRTDGSPYVKDYNGNVFGEGEALELARNLAKINEVGFVKLPYFPVGDYKGEYKFLIYPPIESDKEFDHINLKLADTHIPYTKVRIIIEDPNNLIVKLYPHLMNYKIEKQEYKWLITSSSSKDELIEVEMLLKPNIVEGYREYVNNVKGKTEFANILYFFCL